jgi:hypothetical protein
LFLRKYDLTNHVFFAILEIGQEFLKNGEANQGGAGQDGWIQGGRPGMKRAA